MQIRKTYNKTTNTKPNQDKYEKFMDSFDYHFSLYIVR